MTETSTRDMQLLLQNTVRLDVQCTRDNGLILVKVSGIETAEVQTYFYSPSLSGPKPIFHFVSLTPLSLHREPYRFYITGSLVLKCLNNLCDILIGTKCLCSVFESDNKKKCKYPQCQAGWKDYLCILIFDIFSVHETS